MDIKKVIAVGIMAMAASAMALDCEVTDVTAQQRYPWNGLVDIAVTFTGSSNEVARMDCTFAATNSATQAALSVNHVAAVEGAQGSGTTWTRHFIWDAAADVGFVKIDDVALTATAGPNLLGGVRLWENGPYWAECNVGATKPEEYGYYFWWGDTVGYTRNANNDGWESVKDGTAFEFSGCPTYAKDNWDLRSAGYIDSTRNLVAAHDAARAHLGAPWRMPTSAEIDALIDNCSTTWTTRNGVSGYLLTGKGAYASKSIFLPAAGDGYDSECRNAASCGHYWSSTPASTNSKDAWRLRFDSSDFDRGNNWRCDGRTVRPLRVSGGTTASGMTTHFTYCASIEVTSVVAQQCYPWNGKVDIAVTFTGSSNEVAQADCTFAVTNSATRAALAVNHVTAVDGAQGERTTWTRHFIWDAAADVGSVKIDDVALTVVAAAGLGGVQLWKNGPYWAECNVGATKPEESGYYFWWGDTVGYKRNANNDGWVSVKDGTSFSFSSGNCPTYSKSNSALRSAGYIDATGNLVAAHDAATAHLGASWRMPTEAELQALIDNCTTTWGMRNGVSGRRVTGKGAYASKSIFLPAAGLGDGSDLDPLDGEFWSSTPNSDDSYIAWSLTFNSGIFYRGTFNLRYIGRSVRPLRVSGGTTANGMTTHFAYCASIEVTSVVAQQCYPWNGKVDIAVTFTGSSNEVAQADCTFAVTNSATRAALAVNHVTAVDGAQGERTTWTRHFIWDASADVGSVKIDDVALTATAAPNLGGVQLWENGPYWAECNVGAIKPEEYGYYFWWGDTVGYTLNANNDWVSVKDGTPFSFTSGNCPTYRKGYSALRSAGYIDSTGNLVAAHDAATAHLGAPWRMPTDAEFQALINNCTIVSTTRNGVDGQLVTGKWAYASKSIFLPAAGYGNDYRLHFRGADGRYWASALFPDDSDSAWSINFSCGDFGRSYDSHDDGLSVRPLRVSGGTIANGMTTHFAYDGIP